MKKIFSLYMLLAAVLLGACEESLDDLTGRYDIDRYNFTEVGDQSTDKLAKGIKSLNMTLSDAEGNALALSFGSREWTLQNGTYTVANEVSGAMQAAATLTTADGQQAQLAAGDINVTMIGADSYDIDGLLQTAGSEHVKVHFRGAISFEIGVDDPEASGYVAVLSVSPVYITDQSGQVTGVVPGMSKYAITISDPDGRDAAMFETINVENLDPAALAGEYTIKDNAQEALSIASGAKLPQEWGGWSWGSYLVNASGSKEFLVAGGKITISVVDGMEGGKLYSFAGSGLTTMLTMNADGSITGGTLSEVNIKYVTMLQSTGYELRDQKMNSTVLGKEMSYSIYLPKSYDNTKTYPVLYLLNGADGNNNDWLQQGMVNPHASGYAADGGKEMIIVCPNGCPDGQNVFYCDNYQSNGINYMTYFFDEFIPFIESTYKVKAEKGSRAVAGLSMGGYGSLYYGFLHQEMFCYIYACSPATYIEGAPNLYMMAPTAELPGITIEIGTEDFLYQSAKGYHDGLASIGVEHEWIERSGAHDWAFWAACTPKIIKKVGEAFQ